MEEKPLAKECFASLVFSGNLTRSSHFPPGVSLLYYNNIFLRKRLVFHAS